MEQPHVEPIAASILNFKLPDYDTIPDVGLYLEQTVKYISDYLSPLENVVLTNSMVSNYVKKGLIDNPVKKLYHREQIAYLFFIAIAKTVLSLEDIQLLIRLQKQSYSSERAYGYFVRELINLLHYVFGLKTTVEEIDTDHTEEKTILRTTIITVAHKIYLDKYFSALHNMQN